MTYKLDKSLFANFIMSAGNNADCEIWHLNAEITSIMGALVLLLVNACKYQ